MGNKCLGPIAIWWCIGLVGISMSAADRTASGTRSASTHPATMPSQKFALVVSSEHDAREIPAGRAVFFRVSLQNVTKAPQAFFLRTLGGANTETVLHITDEDGRPVPLTRYGELVEEWRENRITGYGTKTLRPGEHYDEVFCVSREFDLSREGTYLISATRIVPKTNLTQFLSGERPVEVISQPVRFTIKDEPRIVVDPQAGRK